MTKKKMSLSERLSSLSPEDPEYPDVLERRALEEEERKQASYEEEQVEETNVNQEDGNPSIEAIELRTFALQIAVSMFESRPVAVIDILNVTDNIYKYLVDGELPPEKPTLDPLSLYVPGAGAGDGSEDGQGEAQGLSGLPDPA